MTLRYSVLALLLAVLTASAARPRVALADAMEKQDRARSSPCSYGAPAVNAAQIDGMTALQWLRTTRIWRVPAAGCGARRREPTQPRRG